MNFYESYNEIGGATKYKANASTIKVKIGFQEYTATGTYHANSPVNIDLPVGSGMTLTITSPDTEYWDYSAPTPEEGNFPIGTFSATLTNVTITKNGENNLGTVNLVRQ